jgi:glucose/arabinose dehydrogenase
VQRSDSDLSTRAGFADSAAPGLQHGQVLRGSHRRAGRVAGHARYIGRVGALAVALGITGAVASSPSLAWADTDSGASGSASSSSGSASSGSGTSTSGAGASDPSTKSSASSSTSDSSDPGPSSAAADAESSAKKAAAEARDRGISEESSDPDSSGKPVDKPTPGPDSADTTSPDANPAPTLGATPSGADDAGAAEAPTIFPDLTAGSEAAPAPVEIDTVPTEVVPGEQVPAPEAVTPPPAEGPVLADAGGPGVPNGQNAVAAGTDSRSQTADAPLELAALSAEDAAMAAYLTEQVAPTLMHADHTHEEPASASGPPRPEQVVAQIQAHINSAVSAIKAQITATVTECLCSVIKQVLVLVNGAGSNVAPTTAETTTAADEGPAAIAWTVLSWVRKQTEYAVAAFNRSPIGVALNSVVTRVTNELVDFGNSPFGRTISATVGAFIEQCNDSTELPAELERSVVIGDLNEPTDFEFITAADDPNHIEQILVIEKSGSVKSYDMHTGELTTLTKLSVVTADGERGLIGIAVDPLLDENGNHTVYLAYTNANNFDQLSKFTLVGDALVNEVTLVESTTPAHEFHHGGELEFDPQGQHLYWGVGNNTVGNSQDLTTIHGKILRLDRDGNPAADNPFIDSPNEVTRMIYAYGLRNPFRFDFAPDGTLLAGDVGEADWEELNVIEAGGNYGWPFAEGPCDGCGAANPLWAYEHSPTTGSGSITAVLVYTDDKLGERYQNKVFVADYSLGWIKELEVDQNFESVISERTFDSAAGAVVKLAQGPDGNIYQLNIYPGQLMVIAPSGGNRAPTAVITSSQTSTAQDSLTVDFSATGSTDPENATLTYHWDFGNGQTSTAAAPTVTFTKVAGDPYTAYTVTLQVSDGAKTSEAVQRIVVGSTPPVVTITASQPTYDAGDTLTFTAVATDDQDGVLPASTYNWTIDFHHLDHKHPFVSQVTGPTVTMTVPRDTDQLDTTSYRVSLTVTDSSGLTTTQYTEVNPNLVTLTVNASDPNASFTIDGKRKVGSYTEQAVVGVIRTLGATSPQTVNGQQVVFGGWSDGGAPTHTFTVGDADSTYTVTYLPAIV